jgi:glycosyltransferase involved in cell wall biosynthesis
MTKAPRLVYVVTSSMSVRFLRDQLSFLQRRGFEVYVVSSPGAELKRAEKAAGIHALELPMEREISPWKDCLALYRLIRIFRSVRPDVVVAGTPKAGLLGMLAAWWTRVRARVYLQWGLRLETTRGLKRLVLLAAERITAACANRVVCVSKSLRKVYLEMGLCRPDKAIVLAAGSANGVDADHFVPTPQLREQAAAIRSQFGIPAEAPVVGFVGRLTRDKGIPELLAAFKQVLATVPEARLLLVGDFESGDPVPGECVDELKTHPQIAITGFVEDPAPYFATMDVFAFASLREGFGIVLLEAAATSLPVAAFRATGVVDAVVDGVTGTLVPGGDHAALAEAVTQYLQDRELRIRRGRNGRERVLRDFRPVRIWEELHKEYLTLMQNNSAVGCAPRTEMSVTT